MTNFAVVVPTYEDYIVPNISPAIPKIEDFEIC